MEVLYSRPGSSVARSLQSSQNITVQGSLQRTVTMTYHLPGDNSPHFFQPQEQFSYWKKQISPRHFEVILSLHTSNAFTALFLLENVTSMRTRLLTLLSHAHSFCKQLRSALYSYNASEIIKKLNISCLINKSNDLSWSSFFLNSLQQH